MNSTFSFGAACSEAPVRAPAKWLGSGPSRLRSGPPAQSECHGRLAVLNYLTGLGVNAARIGVNACGAPAIRAQNAGESSRPTPSIGVTPEGHREPVAVQGRRSSDVVECAGGISTIKGVSAGHDELHAPQGDPTIPCRQ